MSSSRGWSCIDGLDASRKKHSKGSSTEIGLKYTMDVTLTNTPTKAARTRLTTSTTSPPTPIARAPSLTDATTQVPDLATPGTRLSSSTISKSLPTSIVSTSGLREVPIKGGPPLPAIIAGAAGGSILICVIIILLLCYWRRVRQRAFFTPRPFLQRRSAMSPDHPLSMGEVCTKERLVRPSPVTDGTSDYGDLPESQLNTIVNPEPDNDEIALREENERLRRENELLRLLAGRPKANKGSS